MTVLTVCPIAGGKWHLTCEVKWQRNKVALPYIQKECPSSFVTERSALNLCTLLAGEILLTFAA